MKLLLQSVKLKFMLQYLISSPIVSPLLGFQLGFYHLHLFYACRRFKHGNWYFAYYVSCAFAALANLRCIGLNHLIIIIIIITSCIEHWIFTCGTFTFRHWNL